MRFQARDDMFAYARGHKIAKVMRTRESLEIYMPLRLHAYIATI